MCAQTVPLLQVLTSVSIIHSVLRLVSTRAPVDTELLTEQLTAVLAQRHHSTTADRVQAHGSFLTGFTLPKRLPVCVSVLEVFEFGSCGLAEGKHQALVLFQYRDLCARSFVIGNHDKTKKKNSNGFFF